MRRKSKASIKLMCLRFYDKHQTKRVGGQNNNKKLPSPFIIITIKSIKIIAIIVMITTMMIFFFRLQPLPSRRNQPQC